MSRNTDMIAALDALSRTRALTDAESVQLERLLRAEKLIPKASGDVCKEGHAIEGDNSMPKQRGRPVCRKCAYEYNNAWNAKNKAKFTNWRGVVV